MDFNEIREAVFDLEGSLSEMMKRKIFYGSIRNFVRHFDEIKNENTRIAVCNRLSDYIEEVRAHDFDFSAKGERLKLARSVLTPLGEIYKTEANFMIIYKLPVALTYGIIGDGILYFTHLSSAYYHIPILTAVMALYHLLWSFLRCRKGGYSEFHTSRASMDTY